jgi:ATP-dependent DNA ligase
LYFSNLVDTFEKMEQTTSRLMLTDYLVCLLKKTPSSTIDKVVYLIQGKLHPDYEGIELGLAEKMVLRALSQSIVGLDIGSLSKIYRETGDLGDTASKIIQAKENNKNQGTTLFLSEKKMMTVDHVYLTLDKSLKLTKEAILEGEVVAIDLQTSEFLPFQELMHRRRKHGIQEAIEEYPVILNIFDVLFVNGNAKTSLIYSQRRDLIEKMIVRRQCSKDNNDNKIRIVPQTIVKNTDQIDKFMASAIESGCEGLMLKHLNSVYRAGAREYAWIKLKREYQSELADTLDLVIVGALYGRGRRVGKYGALLLAAYDSASDIFRSTCKVGTGFTDKDLEGFYISLEKHRIKHKHARVDSKMQMDVWFEPKIVIEVIASAVTLSPSHTAAIDSIRPSYGLALRFPKFTGKIRDDKNPEDATDVGELVSMYKHQMQQQVLRPDKS